MTKKIESIFLVNDHPGGQFLFQDILLEVDSSIPYLNSINGIHTIIKSNSENICVLSDLSFMCVNKPGVSGIDCCKELQKREKPNFFLQSCNILKPSLKWTLQNIRL